MNPRNFTTEYTEKNNFRFVKSSVNSMVASSAIENPLKEVTELIISSAIEVQQKNTNTMRAQRGKRLSRNNLLCLKLFSVLSVVNF